MPSLSWVSTANLSLNPTNTHAMSRSVLPRAGLEVMFSESLTEDTQLSREMAEVKILMTKNSLRVTQILSHS